MIGEVLYDQFPDGRRILGGAPFNVAWNLQAFGHQPIFVSAVGNDELGLSIRNKMSDQSMSMIGLTTDDRPTGVVQVRFEDGEPQYEIVPDRAYDHLDYQSQLTADHQISVIYHGSLAWRSPKSRQAILAYRKALPDKPVFVDLNIRMPWFDSAWLPELLQNVHSLKLSVEELRELIPSFSLSEASPREDSALAVKRASDELKQQFKIQRLWVTDGGDGAYLVDGDDCPVFQPAVKLDRLEDTIGAGDAFSSAVISGWLRGDGTEKILSNAARFAAKVCTLNGATTSATDFYRI